MHQNKIIAEVAMLDGWTGIEFGDWIGNPYGYSPESGNRVQLPDYYVSRDAVIPVIAKQLQHIQVAVVDALTPSHRDFTAEVAVAAMTAPAFQLCIALVKAAGKWREE